MAMPHISGGFMGSITTEIHSMPLWKVKKFFPNVYERERKRRAKAKSSKSRSKKR